MKCGEQFNIINISVKVKFKYPNGRGEIANFHFSNYKSIETLSYHSKKKQLDTDNKNITVIEGNVILSKCAKFLLQPPNGF